MKKNMLCVALLALFAVSPGFGQRTPTRGAATPPSTWVSVYFQMYTTIGGFFDPTSESRWVFDDYAFGFGGEVHRAVGQSLLLGVDASYAKPAYERNDPEQNNELITRGDATLVTAMATGRMAYGGAAELGFYLTGGVGAIAYKLEDLDSWNRDFALRAGTGLEYRFARNKSLYLEWGRMWAYHEKDGVRGGRANHSVLRLGARAGF